MTEEVKNEEVHNEQVSEPTTQEVQKEDNPVKAFEIPTEAQEYVGEGKKYKSPEDALRSVPHAQEHISTLEAELAQVKEELSKRKTAQELLDEIKSEHQVEATPSQPEVNQDTIEQLVQKKLEQNEMSKRAKANADSVANKFTAKFGDQAETAYNQIAKDSGMTVQQLNSLAASSPNAVLKMAGLMGADAPVSTTARGSVNTEALNNAPKTETLSARVPKGASTKDLVTAWKNAGSKINKS